MTLSNITPEAKTKPYVSAQAARPNFVPLLLTSLIVLYIGAIMALHWLRYERFMNGFDLAFYQQAAWNTGQGRFFAVSATDFSQSLLGTDVLLIFGLMSPLYLLVPSPFTLLFQETLVVGLGAIPVYWLARDHLHSRTAGLTLALVYLLLPGVQNGNLYELRERPLAMSFLLFAFYYYQRGRFWPFIVFSLLALSCRPENGLVLVMLALYGFIGQQHKTQGWRFVAGPFLLGAGWFALATLLIIPSASTGSIALAENFAGGSPFAAGLVLFTNPAEFFPGNALVGKFLYFPFLLLPLLFLPLGRPGVLLMALPSLALNLLSVRPIQWNAYDYHYQGSIIPWLLIATIFSLEKWPTELLKPLRLPWFKLKKAGPGLVLGMTLLVYLVFNIGGLSIPDTVRTDNGVAKILSRSVQPRWEAGKELLKLIPDDAPLAITNLWASHVPPRQGLWLFREKSLYSLHPTREAQYIFADLRAEDDKKLLDSLSLTEWQVLAEKQSYIVLKRINS